MPFRRLAAFGVAALTASAFCVSVSSNAHAQDCDPPRILLVLDASSSMLGDAGTGSSKWDALQSAVGAVFTSHGDSAQYGLMTFPGATGGCSSGDVEVAIAPNQAAGIELALSARTIAVDSATPAGQTLAAAAQNTDLTDPANPGYVIFMTDGWQFCDVDTGGAPVCATQADCTTMGVGSCPSCNSCATNSSDPNCAGQSSDGCYCVRNWPTLGVEALAAAGVKTYVVGFGQNTDVLTLNRAGFASGTAPAGCDPDSMSPSCYFQATSPTELTDALGDIVANLVTETCSGDCNIDGTRTCTSSGWTACDSPDTVSCSTSCGTGTQTCVGGELSDCEPGCGTGGAGGGAGSSAGGSSAGSSGTGGASAGGNGGSAAGGDGSGGSAGSAGSQGSGEGGAGGSTQGAGATGGDGSGGSAGSGSVPRGDAGLDTGDDGSCACRTVGESGNSSIPAGLGLLILAGFAGRRRRTLLARGSR